MKRELQYRHRDLFDDNEPSIPLSPNRKNLRDLVGALLSEIVTAAEKTEEVCDDKDHA
jgi:hypothetical protein